VLSPRVPRGESGAQPSSCWRVDPWVLRTIRIRVRHSIRRAHQKAALEDHFPHFPHIPIARRVRTPGTIVMKMNPLPLVCASLLVLALVQPAAAASCASMGITDSSSCSSRGGYIWLTSGATGVVTTGGVTYIGPVCQGSGIVCGVPDASSTPSPSPPSPPPPSPPPPSPAPSASYGE